MAIFLCMLLIAYDILVLIDPTRCFFYNCNEATINVSNSTTNIIIVGWPIYVTWPEYFQTNMNAKRIFQAIQILLAGLFILFASLFLLTYFIYRHIRLHQQTMYRAENGTFTTYEKSPRAAMMHSNNVAPSPLSHYTPTHKVTTFVVTGSTNSIPVKRELSPKKPKAKTFIRPRANSLDNDRLCTRCNQEPRMIIASSYERQNFFPNLCINCNNELVNTRRRPVFNQSKMSRVWKH